MSGVAVTAWGAAPAFWVNAASFAASALILTRLRLPHVPAAMPGRWASRVTEGGRLLVRDRLLRPLAVVQLLAALSAGATSALLVVLASEHLNAGAPPPSLRVGPYLLRGFVDLVLATTRNVPAAAAALTLYGAGTSTGMVTHSSLLQAEVPAEHRGRVFASFDMIWQTGRLASLAVVGIAADQFGIQAVYALGGLLLLAAGTIGLTGMPLSKPDDPSSPARAPE